MTVTIEDINRWKKEAKRRKATHIISVCDTFEHDDYPVYVTPGENLDKIKARYNGVNMQKINEVIKV